MVVLAGPATYPNGRYAASFQLTLPDFNSILPVRSPREGIMTDPATTKLSSKGQVVIPEEIRDRLGLKTGAQFVVLGDRDVVILKVIQTPDRAQFDDLVGRARKAARSAGLKRKDVDRAIRRVRTRK
jgi:AbrB family looped-hinge helix DNA binding protein